MNYLLTVLIPTYNTRDYLTRSVESLLHDTINGKVQILIVNDGSTDDSLSIARHYESSYPFVQVIDKPNGGYGSTLNAGIPQAQGRYFRILDSDDWYETKAFVQFVEQLEHETADVVLTWGYLDKVYQQTCEPDHLYSDDSFLEYGRTYTFSDFDFHGKFFRMGHMTYRTDILRQVKESYSEKLFYVDTEFLFYPMTFADNFVFYNLSIYHYFLGRPGQSMSQEIRVRNASHLRQISESLLNFYAREHVHWNPHKLAYMQMILRDTLAGYYVLLFPGRPLSRIRKELHSWDTYLYNTYGSDVYHLIDSVHSVRYYRCWRGLFLYVFQFRNWWRNKPFSI